MKKIGSIILSLAIVLSLAACGKSEAAKQVDEMILGIGTVTLQSEAGVKTAEAAYDALTQEQKDELDNYAVLAAARASLDSLLAQKKAEEEAAAAAAAEAARIEGIKKVAADVDAAIAAIGVVSIENAAVVAEARGAYEALDEETKSHVTGLGELEKAESTLNNLRAEAAGALIDAIGTVSLESSEAIQAAETAFKNLSDDVKAMVENGDVLTTARETYNSLLTEYGEKHLKKLRLEEDLVRGIKFYYASTFPYYESYGYWGADVRCFVLPYLGVQGNSVWLRLVCDYTADDWVFFKKIIFAVDDQRYYRYYNYNDVVRDNAYGDIWEYVDIEVGEEEIELLKAIANSENTIVRFEGDTYYDDVVIKDSDKEAIKEILLIYEYLKNR